MTKTISIELPDDLYKSTAESASRAGLDLQSWLVRQVGYAAPTPEMRQESLERLLRRIDAASPVAADNSHNEQIDSDLADEYADTHDEPR